MLRRVALVSCLLGGLACASPSVAPLSAGPISPGPGERVAVTHSYLVVDSSESVQHDFATDKALVQSFVGAQPDGNYEAGSRVFGGYKRQTQPLAPFNRAESQANAASIERLREGTPLDRVFNEVGADLQGKSGQAAVIVFSDGHPTDPVGRELDQQKVLDSAAGLASSYQGQVCIHTVHTGEDAEGAEFLRRLSATTGCGSARSSSSVMNVAALQNFEREVFLAAAPADVAAAPRDSDGDGVMDDQDQCPGTPAGVTVDERGCWVIRNLRFAFDSYKIEPQYYDELNEVAARLKSVGSDVRVSIDGHTDSIGTAAYNQGLSERRANAVRDFLVKAGVPASQLSSRGFGLTQPAYPNETAEGRAGNRRVELSRLM
jgi:OOP family OmpA-OmpF porin